jgi:chromate transporter
MHGSRLVPAFVFLQGTVMPIDPMDGPATMEDSGQSVSDGRAVTLLDLALTFFLIGATSFGGMWAATQKLEDTLVRDKRWLTTEEQHTLMVAATLIPAPKFLAFGGMVGFRLGGWRGSAVTIFSLIAPGALFVLLGVMLLNPEVIGPSLVPIQRAVGIGVTGLLFGNAYHQIRGAKVTGRQKLVGTCLALSVAGAAIAGVPLLVASLAGFAIGAMLIRAREQSGEAE